MTKYVLAVVGKQLPNIAMEGLTNTILVDTINISELDFRSTFFNQNIFSVKKNAYTAIEGITNFVPCPSYSPINSTFRLFDCILQCAEVDLNNAPITPISQIELMKDTKSITSLSDLKVITSLRYSDIEVTSGNTFSITAVFTNPNCYIKPVVIQYNYVIV